VHDARHASAYELARAQLEIWLHDELPPPSVDRSEAGRAVAWHTVDRERRKLVAGAHLGECSLLLDGRPTPFTFLQVGERWVAALHMSGSTITVSADRIDPGVLSLRPLDRPVEQLLGEPGE
jgi:hypothetical protein